VILLLDNHDSFVHNLAQLLRALGAPTRVARNDAIGPRDLDELRPAGLVLSPGPGRPADAGRQREIIDALPDALPVLGVCLGHQALLEAAGARLVEDEAPVHGRTSPVRHDGAPLFAGVPSPFEAMRYHSLVVLEEGLPPDWRPTAWSMDGRLMAASHWTLPRHGVQFHPESFLTASGGRIVANFLDVCFAARA
jgi:anthranilate synthase/aminodeoxychorismate synthase-like glutamine amidotransferase